MKKILNSSKFEKHFLILALLLHFFMFSAMAQEIVSIPMTVDDILNTKSPVPPPQNSADINEKLRNMAGATRFSQEYLLGPGDIIQVTVFGISEIDQKELTLDSSGEVSLPFIGTVPLIGMTPRESEVKIEELYKASVIKNPQVSVTVKEYHSQFINIAGAVIKPGAYQLTRRTFLLDALLMAGGLQPDKSESKVYVHRFPDSSDDNVSVEQAPTITSQDMLNSTEKSFNTIEIDLQRLLDSGDITLNIQIYAGDIISVPERVLKFFYVLGDVNRSAAFEMKRDEIVTLTKAIAYAGGLLSTAKQKKSVVVRQTADGNTEQIEVNIGDILKGKKPDMILVSNDIVFVPGSTTKVVGNKLLSIVGGAVNIGMGY